MLMSRRSRPLLAGAAAAVLALSAAPVQARQAGTAADQERRLQEELRAPRPIDAASSVWIDELTWMEVRDAVAAGHTTAILSTGGIEQNGPYLVTGKHNVILRGVCEALAKELGNALCAPVIPFVPEGDIEPKSGHMRYPGTISVREETYRMLLDDVASSLHAHGFTEIILIGDSGGNQRGLEATAATLNERWRGTGGRALYIPEFYAYDALLEHMNALGVVEPDDEGLHDALWITVLMMTVDPASVRYEERVRAGRATINGASIEPLEERVELGRQLMQFRVRQTIDAIRAARAAPANGPK